MIDEKAIEPPLSPPPSYSPLAPIRDFGPITEHGYPPPSSLDAYPATSQPVVWSYPHSPPGQSPGSSSTLPHPSPNSRQSFISQNSPRSQQGHHASADPRRSLAAAASQEPMSQEMRTAIQYQAQLYARCARGDHDVVRKHGVMGIVGAVLLFPFGLLCLFVDVEEKCARCGVKL